MLESNNLLVILAILFIILISIQYSLNKIIVLLKEIKGILIKNRKEIN